MHDLMVKFKFSAMFEEEIPLKTDVKMMSKPQRETLKSNKLQSCQGNEWFWTFFEASKHF